MKIFLIGPGGVGKTSSGKILANLFGVNFIDLDQEFCDRIGNIGEFISSKGYEKYCYQNSELFYEILEKSGNDFVFALSSGFLVHENLDDLVLNHKKTLREEGLSVLLMPSESINESVEIIVRRQLSRGLGLNEKREREKFLKRFSKYLKMGDVQIFSCEKPEIVAEEIKRKTLK